MRLVANPIPVMTVECILSTQCHAHRALSQSRKAQVAPAEQLHEGMGEQNRHRLCSKILFVFACPICSSLIGALQRLMDIPCSAEVEYSRRFVSNYRSPENAD